MVSVVDSESLVFRAAEYGANNVSGKEKQEEPIVEAGVVVGVKD